MRRAAPILLLAVLSLGGCAAATAPGRQDMAGALICPANPTLCGGACCGTECVDTSIDPRNCGACGGGCEAGTVCANGLCGCLPTGARCGVGQSCCGNNGCKSLSSDANNCGACGKGCGSGATCEGGACRCGGATCAAGQVCCGGACAASCASAPDMAQPPPCQCPNGCPLTGLCVGPGCCYEDVALLHRCQPDPGCTLSGPTP